MDKVATGPVASVSISEASEASISEGDFTSPSAADDTLVQAYLAGDKGAFDVLYQRHKDPLYRFFLRQMSHAQANDAFQDTWVKLIDGLHRYQPRGQFKSYLFTIGHNVLLDQHRKQMRTPELTDAQSTVDNTSSPTPTPAATNEQQELQRKLHQEIAKLPLNQRTVWLLQQETGLSVAEIARLTRTSVEGAKSRLRYAKQTLKAGMQRYVRS